MTYDFSSLNDKEFERFARDILNFKFNLDLQDFKYGKDLGRDLRYSTPQNNNAVVVQAKHWPRSSYAKLLKELKDSELPKITALKPDRYIVVTSVELSAKNKDDIFDTLSPFVLTPNDIFGCEDLNKYIAELPEIETKWYKLWLSSVVVLNRVLHNAVLGRSAFAEIKIRRSIQLYVHCKSYDDAFEILKENKYILITGQPGVGKTTLANALSFYLLSQEHQLVYIDGDIKEAEHIFSADPAVKQFFYFDDFLGSNYFEIQNQRTTESSFVNFLDRVINTPGKYLILTTRTSVYNNAVEKYEKMRRSKVDMARREIRLGEYSDWDKANILYNHLFHTKLPQPYLDSVFENKNYWKIIRHRNYNPRLIEYITDPYNLSQAEKEGYMAFVIKHLDNPAEIWRHAYEAQLSPEEKLLLHTVYSQRYNTDMGDTKLMFEEFLQYEVKNYNLRPASNPFNNACRKLLDGILKREVVIVSRSDVLNFINPSIRDFLTGYFSDNAEERWKLIRGSVYIEQLQQYQQMFFGYFDSKMENLKEEASKFAGYMVQNKTQFKSYQELKKEKSRDKFVLLRLCALVNQFVYLTDEVRERIQDFNLEVISGYPPEDLNSETFEYYIGILKNLSYLSPAFDHAKEQWSRIALALFAAAVTEEEFSEIILVFDQFMEDYKLFVKKREALLLVREKITELVDEETGDWIRDEKRSLYSPEDVERLKKDIAGRRAALFGKFSLEEEEDIANFFPGDHVEEWIEQNISYESQRDLQTILDNKQEKKVSDKDDYLKDIEELFVGKFDRMDPLVMALDLTSSSAPF